MGKRKRLLACLMSFVLLLPAISIPVVASDPPAGMIDITSDWQGSVFGDVGGADKITPANFGITENGSGTVTLKSADNRGKISESTDGIAYYYKDVPVDADFELTAKATVDAWTANNQVAFGIMLRDEIFMNVHGGVYGVGDYVAVGALDQDIKGFTRLGGAQGKLTFDNPIEAPTSNNVYDLSIKKSGNNYTLKVGNEIKVLENYSGSIQYAGLFTARNTTVTFSNVNLNIETPVDVGVWDFSAFGGNTSAIKNPVPTVHPDGSITLSAANGGKISGTEEGMSFYYKEMPADANFEIVAKATVKSFNDTSLNNENQKSFGLMLKDQIGVNGVTTLHTSNYVAVGGFGAKSPALNDMRGFYKLGTQTKLSPFSGINMPAHNEVYDLRIKKTGNAYVVTVNGTSEKIVLNQNLSNDKIYAGLYVAREAEITFSSLDIKMDTRVPSDLRIDTTSMKKTYLVGEDLDLNGMTVTAVYAGGAEEVLTKLDYLDSGFDSSNVGTNQVTIHFNGVTETIELDIIALEVTDLTIKYFPAKTDYYVGDSFDPEGFVVEANYNNGYMLKELTNDLYTFSISGMEITPAHVFDSPGTITMAVTSTETPAASTTFNIEVKSAAISELLIKKKPEKETYFIGDDLNLNGLIVYAQYDDNTEVRLMKGEYTVSPLDSTTAGSKSLTITHKGKTAVFTVTVKVKALVGIEVTKYPQTLYYILEDFDSTGLEISKVYDNADKVLLPVGEYTVDSTTHYDNTKPGVYEIHIAPTDTNLQPIVIHVTVREKTEVEWKSIRFGQSTSDANNKVMINTDTSVTVEAIAGSAGKVTGDHDGISFYYTEIDASEDNFVLSADIKVIDYAKNPHDGQESFGIMARDAIGTAGDSSVFASNIAAIGGFSGSTTNANGTQLFVRTGVTTPDGAGSQGIQTRMIENVRPASSNTYPAQPYRLTLAKTNSGYTGKLNNGTEAIFFTPDILNVQDSKIYVGFYAARLATIEVSNIQFTVTATQTDPPRIEPPLQAVTPGFEIVSLDKTSETDYDLMVKSNVDGTITVKEGQRVIAQDQAIESGQLFTIPASLTANGQTNFSITYLPNDTQLLTSYDKIVRNFTVTTKSYLGDIYVSPSGTVGGLGSVSSPLDLDTAIQFVAPGQKIMMLDGRYVRNSSIHIKKYNDGKAAAMKSLIAAPGAQPIIDFDKKSEGVVLGGNYWHVKGIDFTRTAGNTKGFTVGGSYNIIESSHFYENGDTGLQISRTDISENDRAHWPSYNLILNSTSHDNRDPSDNNADGFAAKLTSGEGNIFRGCIAHNNIDDGWDLYTKAGTGAIGAVIIEDSIAYNNGFLSNGTTGAGDKNGFKLGGEGIHVPHIIRNSIAIGNGAYGFTSNSNPGVIARNNISFNNAKGNISFTTYANIQTDFTIDGFVSYQKDFTAKDIYPSALSSDKNFMFNGTASVNKSGVQLTDADFVSVVPVIPYTRDVTGQIILGDFMKWSTSQPNPDGGSDGDIPDQGGPGGSGLGGIIGSSSSGSSDNKLGTLIKALTTIKGNTVQSTITQTQLNGALAQAKADVTGVKQVQVDIPTVAGAHSYELTLPSASVSTAGKLQQIAVSTEIADVVLAGNMLSGVLLADSRTITLKMTRVDPATIPTDVRNAIGNRPVIELSITTADGKKVGFNNPDAPVKVSIPYQPTAEELKFPEHISIWYLDASGKAIAVPTGKYDAATGKVTFITNHFSQFAVVHVQKSFKDLEKVAWAKSEIEVLASKGVVKGTTTTTFSPSENVTRADFIIMLVRALGLSASMDMDSNFSDVKPTAYYYDEVGMAKKLGIVNGKADGQFYPSENISRQDMFMITAKALRAAGVWGASEAALTELNAFTDRTNISAYAVSAIAELVKTGIVKGDAKLQLNPLSQSTRAEAAIIIYKMYNLN
ncbi:bacterial Ig-like domain-containing protein [Paenibacillus sp. FA6]|uniref:bacterial Ig-like domain-containing protein n=1 Tax=Paenibacillus sp. FA6 TaxID=3413029 RepID=UPI003F655F6E